MSHPIPANNIRTLRGLGEGSNSTPLDVTRLSSSENRQLPPMDGSHHGPPNAASVLASMASQREAKSSPRTPAIARTVTGTRYDALGRPR
jgi:hypothetical protein